MAYNNYLILASFFNNTDDFCLADHYYRQALKVTEDHAQLDPLFSAEAYGLLASAHERRGKTNEFDSLIFLTRSKFQAIYSKQ